MQLLQRQALQQFEPRVAPTTFREFGGPGIPGGPTGITAIPFEGGGGIGPIPTPTIGPGFIPPFPIPDTGPFTRGEFDGIFGRSGFQRFGQEGAFNFGTQPQGTEEEKKTPATQPFNPFDINQDPFKKTF